MWKNTREGYNVHQNEKWFINLINENFISELVPKAMLQTLAAENKDVYKSAQNDKKIYFILHLPLSHVLHKVQQRI